MKPTVRSRSQLLFCKSYKPQRVIRIRPVKLNFAFRPVRFVSRSSKAEHPADNRKTAERYRAGQPIYGRRTSPPE